MDNSPKFNHVVEAIHYAQQTGNKAPLDEYTGNRLSETATNLLGSIDRSKPDAMYFATAYMMALSEANLSSMARDEVELVKAIKSCIQMTIVKVQLPFGMTGNDSEN